MLFLLNHKEKMVGVFNNSTPNACPYYDDKHTENLVSGVNTYQFSIPANHATAEKVEAEGYVLFRDLDDRMQMFQIKEIDESADDDSYIKSIYCEHIAIPELLGCAIRPVTYKSTQLETIVNYILDGTGWTLGDIEFTDSKDVVIEDYATALETLLSVLEQYGAEIQYEAVFQNGVVTKRLIHILKKRGRLTYKRFTYGKDLKEVSRKENSEGVVTALIGIGKGDDSKKRMDLVGYKTYLPDGYEKEFETDFIADMAAFQRYNRNGRHIMGIFQDESATSRELLFDNTLKELRKRSKPQLSYSMSVLTLERNTGLSYEEIRLGDTIMADDDTFRPRLVLEARIIELARSYTDPEQDAVTLGDYRPIAIATNNTIQKIRDKISQNEAAWNAASYKVEIISTDGLMFKNSVINTVLNALVYRNGIHVTDKIDANAFKWTRTSLDAESDAAWNTEHAGGTKQITITTEDVRVRATFNCEVNIDANTLN